MFPGKTNLKRKIITNLIWQQLTLQELKMNKQSDKIIQSKGNIVKNLWIKRR